MSPKVPDKPRPWLISIARFKAINAMRRRTRFDSAQKDLALYFEERINEERINEERINEERINEERINEERINEERNNEERNNEAQPVKAPQVEEEIEDDRLRLFFTCCHPALPPEQQVALTLREVCRLTTEEIARAFLVSPATLAQRIVRAKAVIRDKAIPYQVPVSQELSARLGAVDRLAPDHPAVQPAGSALSDRGTQPRPTAPA